MKVSIVCHPLIDHSLICHPKERNVHGGVSVKFNATSNITPVCFEGLWDN